MLNVYLPERVTQGRRVRRLEIMPSMLLAWMQDMCEERAWVVTGLPEDARVLETRMDNDHGLIVMVVESESFDEVPDGNMIESLRMFVQRHDLTWVAK
jgi:hypothetical protein